MNIDKEIERLKRLEKNPVSCLPWTWKEDLPVIPVKNVIEMLEDFRKLGNAEEKKCDHCGEKAENEHKGYDLCDNCYNKTREIDG